MVTRKTKEKLVKEVKNEEGGGQKKYIVQIFSRTSEMKKAVEINLLQDTKFI